MTYSITLQRVAASLLLIGLLSACGGGDGYTDPLPPSPEAKNEPPASASASDAGLVSYVATVTATMPDMAQPLDLSNFVQPMAAADNVAPVATSNDSMG